MGFTIEALAALAEEEMSYQHSAFVGSVPEKYDRYLGPILFYDYASDLVSRIPAAGLMSALELACGTGILTERLRDRLPTDATLVATDLNQAMIDCARAKLGGLESIEWRQADATDLPFRDETFDLVACQFGLMFFPDKKAGMSEAYRVLTRGGLFLFNVWDALDQNEMTLVAHEAVKEFFDADPPLFYEIPFGFNDRDKIEGLLREVGFREVEASTVTLVCRSPSAEDAATGLVEGTPMIGQILDRDKSAVPEVRKAVASAIRARYGGGPIESSMQALVWRAVK